MKLAIFCDFDDTITTANVTDTILERFADPVWRDIQEDWLAGKINAREVLEQQMPLITAGREELDTLIASFEVDPFFGEFALYCAESNHGLYILSDGFDYWIEKILARALSPYNGSIKKIPVFACGLRPGQKKVSISFPYFPGGCAHGCATCKPTLFEQLRAGSDSSVIIGDGVSDLLLARRADLVVAKGPLREFCQRERIAHKAFHNFGDVMQIIRAFQQTV